MSHVYPPNSKVDGEGRTQRHDSCGGDKNSATRSILQHHGSFQTLNTGSPRPLNVCEGRGASLCWGGRMRPPYVGIATSVLPRPRRNQTRIDRLELEPRLVQIG